MTHNDEFHEDRFDETFQKDLDRTRAAPGDAVMVSSQPGVSQEMKSAGP